jgi:hypothetical protein
MKIYYINSILPAVYLIITHIVLISRVISEHFHHLIKEIKSYA